jgi:hypothetical protein
LSFAIDASVVIAAANGRDPRQAAAAEAVVRAAAGAEAFFLFWPVVAAYLRVMTSVEMGRRPLSLAEAWANMNAMLELDHCFAPAEPVDFGQTYQRVLLAVGARGKFVHDAHLVALMSAHGVPAIWTYDRDFRRFDGIRVVEP